MTKHGIVPIKQMWIQGRWVVYRGDRHLLDATGDVISEDKNSIALGNRADGKQIRILRRQIQHEETIE